MKLSAEASIALNALYDSPNYTGDLVELFTKKGVANPVERAKSAGEELNDWGLLEYYQGEARLHADAKLNRAGIKLAGGKH